MLVDYYCLHCLHYFKLTLPTKTSYEPSSWRSSVSALLLAEIPSTSVTTMKEEPILAKMVFFTFYLKSTYRQKKMFLLIAVAAIGQPAPGGRPKFSWDTLPVFFHSCNTSGPWSDAAVHQIARFPMVKLLLITFLYIHFMWQAVF